MSKIFKSFFYIVGCAVVFLFLIRVYSGPIPSPNTANAFEWEKQVQVYFINSKLENEKEKDCSAVFPLTRTILNAETLDPGSFEALLKGLNPLEKEQGYSSAINENVLVQKFEIKNGVALIDVSSEFNKGVVGVCRVQSIKAQIEKTLTSLSDINSVVISVNGKTEGILEP